MIALENIENHENLKIPIENHANNENLIISIRYTKLIKKTHNFT